MEESREQGISVLRSPRWLFPDSYPQGWDALDLSPDPGPCFLRPQGRGHRSWAESLLPAPPSLPLPAPSTHQSKLVDLARASTSLGATAALLGLQVVAQPLQLGLPRRVTRVIDPRSHLKDARPLRSAAGRQAHSGGLLRLSRCSPMPSKPPSPLPWGLCQRNQLLWTTQKLLMYGEPTPNPAEGTGLSAEPEQRTDGGRFVERQGTVLQVMGSPGTAPLQP